MTHERGDASSFAPCEYYMVPNLVVTLSPDTCPPWERYVVQDLIPPVALCHKHITEYEVGKRGTVLRPRDLRR